MLILAGNWGTFILRGVVAILFGLLTFLMPGMALLTLVFMFGFFAIADGILTFMAAFRRSRGERDAPGWALILSGILGIVAGILALLWPGLTAIILLYLIAGWAIATGVLEIVAAVALRKEIHNEWLLGLAGFLSILLGLFLAFFPGPGALAVVFWIGAFALAFGALLIALGLRLRKWARTHEWRPGVLHR
jgi:uncharacterized membrane protein HdeD (DUF308 family)